MGHLIHGTLSLWDTHFMGQFMGNSVHGTLSSSEIQSSLRDSTVFAIRHPGK